MTVAISKALEEGAKAVVCASTGNTSASAAAYAVCEPGWTPHRAGPFMARSHRAQAGPGGRSRRPHRRRSGDFDDCLRLARGAGRRLPGSPGELTQPASPRPARRLPPSRSSTTSGTRPMCTCCQWATRGISQAHWMGYQEYAADAVATRRPRMWGFQASGAAPIVRGEPVADPVTVASAIRIGNPASWQLAVPARDESHGLIDEVTDEQILVAQQELSGREGLFVEPASAAGVAGLVGASPAGTGRPRPDHRRHCQRSRPQGRRHRERGVRRRAVPRFGAC